MTTSKISTLYKSILHYKLTFVGFESLLEAFYLFFNHIYHCSQQKEDRNTLIKVS